MSALYKVRRCRFLLIYVFVKKFVFYVLYMLVDDECRHVSFPINFVRTRTQKCAFRIEVKANFCIKV